MKYIDAEKLIMGIEHLYPDSTDEQVVEGFSYGLDKVKSLITSLQQEQRTCKTCGFYKNNCPFIRGKLTSYPKKVCKDYTYSAMKEQGQPEGLSVPKWLLRNIEDTLRIQNNINNDENSGETCQDRNIRGCLNGVRKILNGEELTGMERLEPLKEN